MKYSLRWISKFLPNILDVNIDNIVSTVWSSVAEVEGIEKTVEKYKGIVVGKVLKIEKHPKSEKLLIVQVDIGEVVTIVTGASNFQIGDYIPVFKVGSKVLSGEVINPREMLGVKSNGMMASELELGLGDDHSGILVLYPEQAMSTLKPGMSFATAYDLDDVIIEIENKSLTHRGDCFSIIGIARELSAVLDLQLKKPDWYMLTPEYIKQSFDSYRNHAGASININIESKDSLERYTAAVIDEVKVEKSPQWMRFTLSKMGINSVNNIVDITNYVMLETGQPLHAFDSAGITSRKRDGGTEYTIGVRNAKNGEKITTLDNKEYVLSDSTMVIADKEKAVAIAGVIGGTDSSITSNTKRIILESACFDMYSVRKTAMNYGLFTDASVIYSRKQDPMNTIRGISLAAELIKRYSGGIAISEIADYFDSKELKTKKSIVVSVKKIISFIGQEISISQIKKTLELLNMKPSQKGDLILINPPTYRRDVNIDEDVYEEIARCYGYNKLTPLLPSRTVKPSLLAGSNSFKREVIQKIISYGFKQIIGYSFISKELYEKSGLDINRCYRIVNAVSPEVQYMRSILTPNLIQHAFKNQYNLDHFGCFEESKVWTKNELFGHEPVNDIHTPKTKYGLDDINLPIEHSHLGLYIVNDTKLPIYYEIKFYIEKFLKNYGIKLDYEKSNDIPKNRFMQLPDWIKDVLSLLKGGRAAILSTDYAGIKTYIGVIGEVNSYIKQVSGVKKELAIAELDMNLINVLKTKVQTYKEIPRLPFVSRDYCFLIKAEVPYSDIESYISTEISSISKNIIAEVSFVDIFSGERNQKQITFRIKFQPIKDTLTDTVIDDIEKKLVTSVSKKFSAKLL